MADTIFPNSYIVSDAELETLIGSNLNAAAVALKALAASDQMWYCQEATRHLDSLPLRGTRYEIKYIENGSQIDANEDGITQVLEFPRIIDGETLDWDNATHRPIVPELVKQACLEEALAIYRAGTAGGLKDLQESGVSSMSIGGKLSYTFVPGAASSSLLSQTARRIMKRYMGAGLR